MKIPKIQIQIIGKVFFTEHKANACKIVKLSNDVSATSRDDMDLANGSFSTTSSSSFPPVNADVLQRQEPFDDDSYIACPTICLDKDNTHTAYFSESCTREIDLDIDSGAVVSTYPFVEDLFD